MKEPRFMTERYAYIDEKTEQWKLKDDAPDWAKQEFDEFFQKVNPKPDENGIVTQY